MSRRRCPRRPCDRRATEPPAESIRPVVRRSEPTIGRAWLLQYQVGDELVDARVVLLRQPEQRLAPHAHVTVFARDADQRIGGRLVAPLRKDEDRVLAEIAVAR